MVKAVDNTEENKKRAFFQAALTMLQAAVTKLVLDAQLREEMVQECLEAWDNILEQANKDAAEKQFLALLARIQQQLQAYWAKIFNSKALTEKLNNVFERIKALSQLKADFAAEQPSIAASMSAIDTGLSAIEASLATIADPSTPVPVVRPILETAAEKFMGHYHDYDALRAKVGDYQLKFAAASDAVQESLSEYTENGPSVDPRMNPIAEQDLSQLADTRQETDILSQYVTMLNALGLRMVGIQSTMRTQTVRYPELAASEWVSQVLGLELANPPMATSRHLFLKPPRPAMGGCKKDDEESNTFVRQINPFQTVLVK